jgi:hypothetical protein
MKEEDVKNFIEESFEFEKSKIDEEKREPGNPRSSIA